MPHSKLNLVADVRERIEKSLSVRTAPKGTALAWIEQRVKSGGTILWRELKQRPSVGIVLVGGTGIALASAIGVGELTLGLFAAYGAYLVLREGMPAAEAALEVFEKAR